MIRAILCRWRLLLSAAFLVGVGCGLHAFLGPVARWSARFAYLPHVNFAQDDAFVFTEPTSVPGEEIIRQPINPLLGEEIFWQPTTKWEIATGKELFTIPETEFRASAWVKGKMYWGRYYYEAEQESARPKLQIVDVRTGATRVIDLPFAPMSNPECNFRAECARMDS